ncbi:MAG: hypothetical protein IJ368_10785 [Oscillospiraceae bacterium]|nr:hypothetical protein [Oscillospiraceae bacterium]
MKSFSVVFDSAKSFWDSSPLAAVFVDKAGRVLYCNSACTQLMAGCKPDYSGIHNGASYETLIYCSERIFRLYVSPVSEEVSIVNPVEISAYGEYTAVLGAAVKNAVNNVSVASDLISEECSEGMIDALNSIDSTMLTLLSEFLIPEQILALEANTADYPAVSLSEAIGSYADELGTVLVKSPTEVFADISGGMFARIDVRSLKLVLSEFITGSFLGEYQPENIKISLFRNGSDTIDLCIGCGYIARIQSDIADSSVPKSCKYIPAEHLKSLLTEKFGCVFKVNSYADCSTLTITLPMADFTPDGLHSSMKRYNVSGRFSDERACFARLGFISRYKK